MWLLIKMAFRNVLRNRLRTALAVVCVFAAVFTNMVVGGLMNGMIGSIIRNYTRTQTGHLRIAAEVFMKRERFLPLDELIAEPAAVEAALRADAYIGPRIETIAERISFPVILSEGSAARPALAMAGDPEKEKTLLMLQKSVAPGGSYLSAPGQILIGAKLAKALGLGLGSPLRVMTQKSDSGLRMKKFTIAGILETGVTSMDDTLLFISLNDAKSLLHTGGATQQILVMLKDYRDSGKAAAAARDALAATGIGTGLAVTPWTDMGVYASYETLMSTAYGVLLIGLSLLGAVIITNIMMMVILERKREIGVMKAMGFKPREILGLFVAEGSVIGLAGSLLGVLAGLGYHAAVLGAGGYDFSSMLSSIQIPLDSVVKPSLGAGRVILVLLAGVLVSAFVSISPSRRAARMNAIEAIRSV
jgi:putative ABC transport system permease protein